MTRIIALTFLCSSAVHAATYRVGVGRPYATLASVANVLSPGDLVEVDGNATYGAVRFTRPGSASAPITIRGLRVNGRRPTISGGANGIEVNADHYVVEGFEITGSTSRCFYHHGDDVTLRDSLITDCPAHGVLGADQDSGSFTMEWVEVRRAGNGTQHHGVYMATDEVAHPGSVFRMQHCYLHDMNGGNAVKTRAERNEIYGNWIEGALYHELELIGPDPDGAPSGWTEGLRREDSDVVGNVIRATTTFHLVRIGGDKAGASTSGRYRFVNNTFLTQGGSTSVFRIFLGVESLEAHNNVFANETSSAPRLTDTSSAEWVGGVARITGTNNFVVSGSTNVPAGFTNSRLGVSPGFASVAGFDLMPQAGSPLIDAANAAPMGLASHPFPSPRTTQPFHPPARAVAATGVASARPMNGGLDIGAFEAGPSAGGGGAAAGGTAATGGGTSGGAGGGSAGGASSGGGGASSAGGGRAGGSAAGGGVAGGASSVGGGRAGGGAAGGGMAGGASSVGGGIAGGASSVGGGIAGGASSVGGGIAGGASAVGGGIAGGASAVGGGIAGGASGGSAMASTAPGCAAAPGPVLLAALLLLAQRRSRGARQPVSD